MAGCVADAHSSGEKAAPKLKTPIRDPEHVFRWHVKSWGEIKLQNVVLQRRDYSCGAATLPRFHWEDPVSEDDVLRAVLKVGDGLIASATGPCYGPHSSAGHESFKHLTQTPSNRAPHGQEENQQPQLQHVRDVLKENPKLTAKEVEA